MMTKRMMLTKMKSRYGFFVQGNIGKASLSAADVQPRVEGQQAAVDGQGAADVASDARGRASPADANAVPERPRNALVHQART